MIVILMLGVVIFFTLLRVVLLLMKLPFPWNGRVQPPNAKTVPLCAG